MNNLKFGGETNGLNELLSNVKRWFTVYRADLNTGTFHVTKYITADIAEEAVKECAKMNRLVQGRPMDHFLWIYDEEEKPPIVAPDGALL